MFRAIRKLTTQKTPFIAGLVVAFVLVTGGAGLAVHKVSAGDCDNNAIIHCGFSSPRSFISDVQNNSDEVGHHDLKAIYAHQFASGQFLSSSMYDDFAAHAVAGTAYKNGNIVVDGKVVARNVSSIGRLESYQGSNPQTYPNVGGHTYYGNTNARAFASDGLPVYVLFDSQGTMQFAVLKSCGNPEFGTVVKTSANCNALQKTPVAGQLNTYTFTASGNVAGNAKITKYVYNFGDGTATVTTTNGSTPVKHTYTKAGNFTASVTEYASVPGNDNLKLPVISMCTKQVVVTIPFYLCSSLTPVTVDKSKFSYRFIAKASNGNGAVFVSTDYNFGDGHMQTVKTTDGKTTTADHVYTKAGTYNLTALLHFTLNGKSVTALHTCTASVFPTQPPASTCKPGVPVGSPECAPPCTEGSSTPPESPECTPPVLPNTGAGNVIAIFAAVVVGAFIVYRQMLFRRHKAAFVAAQQGTSALPLADPLSETPLAGTPLAPKRRSFRRKRPF